MTDDRLDARPEPASLADALPREIARVSAKMERWKAYAREMPETAQGMFMGITLMNFTIRNAIAAAEWGDVAAMLEAYEALKEYDDDD